MNTRPPPYNPYMHSITPQPNNIPTAPPMDDFQQIHVSYLPPIQTHSAYPLSAQINNYIPTAPPMDNFVQVPISYPPPIQRHPTYPYPPHPLPPTFNYIQNAEQYRRDEIERRRQQDNECCCFAILATLCCCFVTTDI